MSFDLLNDVCDCVQKKRSAELDVEKGLEDKRLRSRSRRQVRSEKNCRLNCFWNKIYFNCAIILLRLLAQI